MAIPFLARITRLILEAVSGDVSAPTDGSLWYNTTTGKLRAREGGVSKDVIGAGGGGSFSIPELVVDFGGTPVPGKTFDMPLAGAAIGQKVIAVPSLTPAPGMAHEDEFEMEPFACAARVVTADQVRLHAYATRGGLLTGQRRINVTLA